MKLAYLAFSDKGYELAKKLAEELGGTAFRSGQDQSLAEWTKEHFASEEGLVFVGAAGIAVRAISPFVADKSTDPAVVVIDEKALNVIPILSGHLGGANDLARRIADVTGAGCVITTATDINGVFAVDEWSKRQGCALIEKERIVRVSGALLGGRKVTVKSRWDIDGEVPEGIEVIGGAEGCGTDGEKADVTLDAFSRDEDTLHIVPKICVLGIGCRKGTKKEAIELLLEKLREETGLLTESVCGVASIDITKEEEGLLEFCADHGWDIDFYSSDELTEVPGDFSGSEMVKSVTGVDNVCERSAALKAGADCGPAAGSIVVKKMAENGVTMAVAMKEYRPDWEWKDE